MYKVGNIKILIGGSISPFLLKKKGVFKKKVFIYVFLWFLFLNFSILALNQVDLNTASIEDLMKVPGIGKVTAKNIVEYREKNGPFTSIDDLIKVKGIGPKKLIQVKPYLIISNSTSKNFSSYPNKSSFIYYYQDEKGVLHYTQFPENVPLKYRKTLKKVD